MTYLATKATERVLVLGGGYIALELSGVFTLRVRGHVGDRGRLFLSGSTATCARTSTKRCAARCGAALHRKSRASSAGMPSCC